jgi:hypothetical protein
MNVVLGVLVLVVNGQIQAAHAVGAYPTVAACSAAVKAAAPAPSALPKGSNLAYMCADLSSDIAKVPTPKTVAPKSHTGESRQTPDSMSKNDRSTDL